VCEIVNEGFGYFIDGRCGGDMGGRRPEGNQGPIKGDKCGGFPIRNKKEKGRALVGAPEYWLGKSELLFPLPEGGGNSWTFVTHRLFHKCG
jgi:hypothetical protein